MRNLFINKTSIKYLNYKGEEQYEDSQHQLTGETIITYYPPKTLKCHVSGAKGSSQVEMFGTEINYDKTLLLTKQEFDKTGITENSVFFIDKPVEYENNCPLYDYRIVRIAETINEVAIAIEKVSK